MKTRESDVHGHRLSRVSLVISFSKINYKYFTE